MVDSGFFFRLHVVGNNGSGFEAWPGRTDGQTINSVDHHRAMGDLEGDGLPNPFTRRSILQSYRPFLVCSIASGRGVASIGGASLRFLFHYHHDNKRSDT